MLDGAMRGHQRDAFTVRKGSADRLTGMPDINVLVGHFARRLPIVPGPRNGIMRLNEATIAARQLVERRTPPPV
jgi:hypothetical protein